MKKKITNKVALVLWVIMVAGTVPVCMQLNVNWHDYMAYLLFGIILSWPVLFYFIGKTVERNMEIMKQLIKQCPECELFVPLGKGSEVKKHFCEPIKKVK